MARRPPEAREKREQAEHRREQEHAEWNDEGCLGIGPATCVLVRYAVVPRRWRHGDKPPALETHGQLSNKRGADDTAPQWGVGVSESSELRTALQQAAWNACVM